MNQSGTIKFKTLYLGTIEVPLSIVREYRCSFCDFNSLNSMERDEQCGRVELYDGTILYSTTNEIEAKPRRRKKNWRHC
ncbi:MAG: hypothetical protein WC919_03230 [Candidatus Paceibacterota bacterium]|jgi:hypothetical protein